MSENHYSYTERITGDEIRFAFDSRTKQTVIGIRNPRDENYRKIKMHTPEFKKILMEMAGDIGIKEIRKI